MKRIAKFLMLSCERAAQLIEKDQYFGLNRVEQAQLFAHTSVCSKCNKWRRQSKSIDRALAQAIKESASTEQKLSAEAKKDIIDKIDRMNPSSRE